MQGKRSVRQGTLITTDQKCPDVLHQISDLCSICASTFTNTPWFPNDTGKNIHILCRIFTICEYFVEYSYFKWYGTWCLECSERCLGYESKHCLEETYQTLG